MTVDGVEYIEMPDNARLHPELTLCSGCAFDGEENTEACHKAIRIAKDTFGNACGVRAVIYIRAEAKDKQT